MVQVRNFAALAVAAVLVFGVGACARNNADQMAGGAGGYGAAAGPGSVQEFNQTVGDRVFFDTDQTDLSSTAQTTLDKQANWLNQYSRYTFTIEGHADERGTREYNFALGAKRAQNVHELPRRQRRLGVADEDDQLRQGASRGRLRRHFLLVAEPPRRHCIERRAAKLKRFDKRPSS